MPRGDGTGPMGMGRMTGRRAGYCSGVAVPGHANPVGYAGALGRGAVVARGFRRIFHASGLPGWMRLGQPADAGAYRANADERELLGRQAECLENQLRQVKKRLSNLEEDAG